MKSERFHSSIVMNPVTWDFMIAVLIILPPPLAWWLWGILPSPFNTIVASALLLGTLTVIYGTFFEVGILKLNKKIVRNSGLPPMKIAIVADFHVGPYRDEEHMQRIVKKIMKLKPDIILLPGDFVFDHKTHIEMLSPLKNLSAPLGVFAVMGNHDSGDHMTLSQVRYKTIDRRKEITEFLESHGIQALRDQHTLIEVKDDHFVIAGIDEQWDDLMHVKELLHDIPEELPIVLMSHNPDVVLNPDSKRAALIVSGHTHGGQIRFPIIGPVYVPAKTGKRFAQGLFQITERTQLAVTHGAGETLARSRLFCPPEIMLLDVIS